MYKLRKGVLNAFDVNGEEKEQKSVYLYEWQWKLLDEVSESSRNQALRVILSNYFETEDASPQIEAALSVLENIRTRTSDEDLRSSIDRVESVLLEKKEAGEDD
jgi:hypothetical protein